MLNRNLLKGLFLIGIALLFGVAALRYPTGGFDRAGPGLFPLLVSSLLFLLGAAAVARSFVLERVPMHFNLKNIAIILVGLCGFALISGHLSMIVGIVFLVFSVALAGTSYSVVRNIKVSVGLIVIAFAFQKFLGVQLPLY